MLRSDFFPVRASGSGGAVVVASNWVALTSGFPDALVSLGVGLIGVALARWVFVNREVRRTSTHQSWKETLPLSLVAALITGVIVVDRKLSVSASAFLGLGVGWAAVILLDILGDRVTAAIRVTFQGGPIDPTLPSKADNSGHDGKMDSSVVDVPAEISQLTIQAEDALSGVRLDEGDKK